MIYDRLGSRTARWVRLQNALLAEAFDWLESLPADPKPGVTELRGKDLVANVYRYDTLPPVECRWESHREMADVHVSLSGGEIIGWAPEGAFDPESDYDPTIEAQFWRPREGSGTPIALPPGTFVLFLPGEIHQPKVFDGTNPSVLKLVFKIRASLLEDSVRPGV